jgi:hypothetical protein
MSGHVVSDTTKGVNPTQKVEGTDSKLGMSGGMLPEMFNFGTLKRHSSEKYTVKYFPYFTSEDIDHVTFSNLLLSVKFQIFLLGTI